MKTKKSAELLPNGMKLKTAMRVTKDYIDEATNSYSEDLSGCGCNFGAEARRRERQEKILRESLSKLARNEEVNEEKPVKKVVIKIKKMKKIS